MKLGTKIGWILVAFSIVLSIWVISGVGTRASELTENDFTVDDNGVLIDYPDASIINVPSSITENGVTRDVTSINGGLFADDTSITSISLPDTVTSVGTAAFSGCTNLGSVTLSGNAAFQSLPQHAFYGCTSLQSIDLKNVVNIGSEAFAKSGLTSITLNGGTAAVSTDAFDNCPSLTSIEVGTGGSGNFSSNEGCLYNTNGSILIRVPEGKTSVNLASTCTSIGDEAFKNSKVTEITIPRSVNSIGTQTNWTPATIYGYTDTAAETYALSRLSDGVTFKALDAADPDDSGSTDTDTSTDSSTTDSSSSSTTSGTYYTVSFNLNGGSGTSTQQKVLAGGHATNPGNPTKQGCTFMGWDYGSAAGDLWNFETYAVNGNVNLTAVWKNADGTIDKGTKTSKSGGSSGNGGHVKDATPKTADGDLDPRYFLSFSFLLVGVAAILYSKRQKMQMIADRRNR